MNYFSEYNQLRKKFNQQEDWIELSEQGIGIRNFSFESLHQYFLPGRKESASLLSDDISLLPDSSISENRFFRYSVFVENAQEKYKEAIILLHGLNEREWSKYLPWASYLTRHTKKPVILFPISFHMNRSPVLWNNRYLMQQISNARKRLFRKNEENSFMNAALSDRINSNPKRFFVSGLESYYNIIDLSKTIIDGEHPLFEKNTRINFFSYSIGAFLTELIMMSNPRNYFKNSKAFLFCGGATFDKMNGTSKFILDKQAGKTLHRFFVRRFHRELKKDQQLQAIVTKTKAGCFFQSMLRMRRMRNFREERLQELSGQIKAVALLKDRVIPSAAVLRTLKGKRNTIPISVEVLDYPYKYTHETPFPVRENKTQEQVDKAFDDTFAIAASFLA
ncbi:MAG: hypothetical protein A2W90_10495 [Bacteroidetes bacterium GWF2_42_66]|nr:MAG: hypothetical protein A2W92_24190 [Bacteroidetes bacterium GWA2_42_15]OFY01481.1 MAG: hypothetical protein A2W89_02020 [Bacteroidetes bacterium GWE2_42_39]OFY43338.1 MAG: hypothetical protein A2W90_10495 [Bacteroidetes bacterium GWF2_42_66]HBL77479.1 hypothetical protein [Prolixibacteraceae bacterium]HCR91296.1 hypothetical protein [Prolixibacteraceae bacterium]